VEFFFSLGCPVAPHLPRNFYGLAVNPSAVTSAKYALRLVNSRVGGLAQPLL